MRIGASWAGMGAVLLFGLVTACGDSSGAGGAGGSATTSTTAVTTGTGSSTSTGVATLNGCTEATAVDHTADATVDLAWTLPEQECIKIKAGTHVVWTGNFMLHPIAGGSPGSAPDNTSPITTTDTTGTTDDVTFPTAGTFPFFCMVHLMSMQGVVYVQ